MSITITSATQASDILSVIIRETEALISSGECHPDWGAKRIVALQKMLEAKESKLQKKRASKLYEKLAKREASDRNEA